LLVGYHEKYPFENLRDKEKRKWLNPPLDAVIMISCDYDKNINFFRPRFELHPRSKP
jgi:hypothetical protein